MNPITAWLNAQDRDTLLLAMVASQAACALALTCLRRQLPASHPYAVWLAGYLRVMAGTNVLAGVLALTGWWN